MSVRLRRESALAGMEPVANASPATAGVVLEERPFQGHFNLRGPIADPRFRAALSGVLGALPPQTPNRVSSAHAVVMYWLGPDEWLLMTADEGRSEVIAVLGGALAGVRHALTEISGGQTVIRISGARARQTIAHGCPLDIHPRVFSGGHCAQTVMAKTPILLHCVASGGDGGAPVYDVVVRRSLSRHLFRWLADAASEYGVAVVGTQSGPVGAHSGRTR